MQWSDFYDNYYDWAESTIRSRISSLKEMGPADEVVDAIVYLPTEQLKVQLIRKAIRYNVEFSHEDFSNLDGELPMEVYRELAAYAGFDADDPYFDEDNMEWDDFYGAYSDWSEKLLLQRIGKLNDFGPTEDVCEVILGMPTSDCEEAIY